jgi:hypothetical protein
MTFLNPLMLFGLLAAGIPVALHLLNKRKLRTIEFSTLVFLKELQKTKIRQIKLRQILLLIVRTLLIVLLILVFSRPTIKGFLAGGLAESTKTTAVIIIDDSYSMTAAGEQGESLQQAKEAAAGVLSMLKEGDEAALIKLSEAGSPNIQFIPQKNLAEARNALHEIQPSAIRRPLRVALGKAAAILAASRNFNKEVYIFSDFQSSVAEAGQNAAKIFPEQTHFFLVRTANRPIHNAAVESVTLPDAILETGKTFLVRATIANEGSFRLTNHVVGIFQDGVRVGEKSVDIDAGKHAEVEFSLIPKQKGPLQGYVVLEDDDLEFDNIRYFTVNVPERISVCLIGSPADSRYCSLAFSTWFSDSASNLKITQLSFDRLNSAILSETNVLVIASFQGLTAERAAQIRTFISNGGGMIIFPSDRMDIPLFNTDIAKPLGMPEIAGREEVQTAANQAGYIELGNIDKRHPVFMGMFEETTDLRLSGSVQKQIESPRIKTFLRLLPNPNTLAIMSASNGTPFLTENTAGEGRVLMFSVAANTQWSDFPLKGLFVPLLCRCVSYAAQNFSPSNSILCGGELSIQMRALPDALFHIDAAGKNEIIAKAIRRGDHSIVHISQTQYPGIYTVKNGNTVVQKIAVNIDPLESSLLAADGNKIQKLFDICGVSRPQIRSATLPEDIRNAVTEMRLGSELWKPLLIAALVVLLIETILARSTKRESTAFSAKNREI